MTNRTWRPLSAISESSKRQYDALHDGIPEWLEDGFWDWVVGSFFESGERPEFSSFSGQIDYELLNDLGLALQFKVPKVIPSMRIDHHGAGQLIDHLKRQNRPLDIADYLLSHGGHGDPNKLDALLQRGKSAWKIGTREGNPGLERRVPEGVQVSVDQVIEGTDSAGTLLARAWEKLYGLHPDPSAAYGCAIKAIEESAKPVVSPGNKTATLGTIIKEMRDQKDWRLPMGRESEHTPSGEVVVGMLRLVWTGQRDRHGGGDDAVKELTREEATVAVAMAVTLVQLFSDDGIVHREGK